MKPQEPIPHNYRMSSLNRIFALSSLGLLGLTGALVMFDYARGWKRFQIGFMQLQRERIEQDLREARERQDRAELTKIEKSVRAQEARIAQNREQFREAQDTLRDWEGQQYAADQNYRFAKARLDAMRYEAEASAQKQSRDAPQKQAAYESMMRQVGELKIELERVTAHRDAALGRVNEFRHEIEEAEARRKQLTAASALLEKQLTTVAPNLPNIALNLPMLDFVNPTLKVDQVVVKDLYMDVNYMQVPRVDRCTTCHRAIDRPGFESKAEARRLIAELEQRLDGFKIPADRMADARARIEELRRVQDRKSIPNPFRTHPHLDKFVGSASAHPMLEFGCTSCHRGGDRATDFARAGHTPSTRRREHEWTEKWGWEFQPFLETPMHPRTNFEAACVRCHSSQITIKGGEKITRASHMVELYGCHSCHKINTWRFTSLRKPGPDLSGIAEKTTPQWALRWVSEPHDFRSTTRMPSFFYQRNMVGPHIKKEEIPGNIAKQNAEVHAIVAYLFANSTRRQWEGGGAGDPARGKQLVESVGCMGCHIAQDTFTGEDGTTRAAHRDDFPLERHYGFNLTGTGTKTHPAWLFNWLKNPKNYYADAPMPDLRLTDQEASDITSYLMTLQKPGFLEKPLPELDRRAVTELARSYLVSTMTERDTDARLAAMPLREQLTFLGQRTIEKYGCYSCHTIKGFENAKPIGADLTIEGSKHRHLFDFGFVHDFEAHDKKKEHITHTVPSWIFAKLRSPRVFDDEREKVYQDKLKMPNFYLSRAEARAISSVILGLTEDRVDPQKMAAKDSRARLVEEGHKLVSQHNCRGCHVVNEYGRAIADTIEDSGLLPPDLTPEGSRVQSDWLFQFLKNPGLNNLRPWLQVRMPTFHFPDMEADTLVRFFAADGRVPQFDSTRQLTPPARNVAVGRVYFEMLRCAQCHPTGAVAVTATTDTASLAPNLQLARTRLRHEWIPDWILRPNEIIPGTRMPTNFPRDPETGAFSSPLSLAIASPQFAQYRNQLLQFYGSEEELNRAVADAPAVSSYLRDYIWSIGSSQMRTPAPADQRLIPPPLPVPAAPAPRETELSQPAPRPASR